LTSFWNAAKSGSFDHSFSFVESFAAAGSAAIVQDSPGDVLLKLVTLFCGVLRGVCRQNIWHKLQLRLAERLPRLIGLF